MLFFIPAWYSKTEWKESEQLWYYRRAQTEFDDTVKQVQLFHRNHSYPYEILLLSYAPNLRHFLHRQSVMRANYWSCFDAIQGIRSKKAAILSYHDLEWPDGVEFIFSNFAILAYLNGKKYAQIEFSEDGNMIRVDLYDSGKIARSNIYDDRGFVSSTIVYEDGKMQYERYLDEDGIWKLSVLPDGTVEVNPQNKSYLLAHNNQEKEASFKKNNYGSIEEVILEVTKEFLKMTEENDVFCIAMHSRHSELLLKALAERKVVLSFYKDRLDLSCDEAAKKLVRNAGEIVVDSSETAATIETEIDLEAARVTEISPFDTRVDFGISQQLHVQNILLPVDDLSNDKIKKIVLEMAKYLETNENARVNLFSRRADFDRKANLLIMVQNVLEEHGFEPLWARDEKDNKFEFRLEEEDSIPVLFKVEQCVDELSVSKCMREQRVVVDLAAVPDLFLQISAVSMAIPQIVARETQYVISEKNGIICKDISKLKDILTFYLGSISNWNAAKVSSYELGQKFTTAQLSNQWREVIDRIEQNQSSSTGE